MINVATSIPTIRKAKMPEVAAIDIPSVKAVVFFGAKGIIFHNKEVFTSPKFGP